MMLSPNVPVIELSNHVRQALAITAAFRSWSGTPFASQLFIPYQRDPGSVLLTEQRDQPLLTSLLCRGLCGGDGSLSVSDL